MSILHRCDCRVTDPVTGRVESFGYLGVDGEDVYLVRHHAVGEPRAAVQICGPVGAERERSYSTLVQLARALASAGFDAFRFDYRGIGESTGAFERLCFSDWRRDVESCIRHITGESRSVPVALWGVRAGAVLAAHCFRAGAADGVMLAAPIGARALLQEVLRRSLIAEMMANPRAPRTTREACIARLRNNEVVNVDGYFWSSRLWDDAENYPFALPRPEEARPWRVLDFKGLPPTELPPWAEPHREPVAEDRFWESAGPLIPKTSSLSDRTIAWMSAVCEKGEGPCDAR